MLLFKYFKDDTGEYLAIRDEYVYYVHIPAASKKEQIITLFSFANEKIEKHYAENKEEIHQMKLFMTQDPQVVERINSVTNYQRIFNISHDEFLETHPR